MNELSSASPPPPQPRLSPKRVANVAIIREPDRLILRPATNALASMLMNSLLGSYFAYSVIGLVRLQSWGWAILFGLIAVLDFTLVAFRAWQIPERITHDLASNRLLGRGDQMRATLEDVKHVALYKEGSVYHLAYVSESGERLKPARVVLLFGKLDDARQVAGEIAGFLQIPVVEEEEPIKA